MFCEQLRVTKREIDEHWSIVDLLEAHELIDVHEELERRANNRAQAAAKSRRA